MEHPYTNRLAREKSPYLLQHAHNAVDWYPWSDEAFDKARQEGKFVFLSVGYSTCHWCHVMEKESFEDVEVAAVLNSVAVPVKVDREERPDVDHVYMAACQALQGSGGWPLTVLLTPERTPFFAGTYFPKESRHGRIGLVDLLRRAGALWQEDPGRVRASAEDIAKRLGQAMRAGPGRGVGVEDLGRAVQLFREQFDTARGGFGPAPKFPTPHNLTFLLRRYRRTGDRQILTMAETTLDAMARGGLFDHLGGGFHRYSTDADWLLPHFEKMLYDQAGLALAYLEAHQSTGAVRWAHVARDTLDYVLRDLSSPEGGFYSAEDADSEGVEGKFYVWTRDEIMETLGTQEGEVFCRVYGVRQEGNFQEEATRRATGHNVLHLPRPLPLTAADMGSLPDELDARLERSRQELFRRREGRVRPHRDDKVLSAWNGLMVSALARGARVLGEPKYAEAAGAAADFVLTALRPRGRLLRRWREGEAAIPGFAEDYAFMAQGLLELYTATLEPSRLAQAVELAKELIRLFWDETADALFDTAHDAEALVLRPKEVYDSATPSANSAAVDVFARLWLLTGDPGWEARGRGALEALGPRVSPYPAAFTHLLQGSALLLEPTREVVVVGPRERPDTAALLAAVRAAWAPETVYLFAPPGPEAEEVAKLAPFTAGMAAAGGRAAAYVCESFSCRAPISDAAELGDLLRTPP